MAKHLNALRMFVRFARCKRLLAVADLTAEDVDELLPLPKVHIERPYHALDAGEMVRLFGGAPAGRDQLVIGLALATGLRVSELAGLRVEDVTAGWLQVYMGKGAKSRRVPLGRRSRRTSGATWPAPAAAGHARPTCAAGSSRDGRVASRCGSCGSSCAAAAAAGLEQVSPHTLRHTYAMSKLRAEMPITHLQKTLGHSQLTTTQRYLDHITDAELAAWA